MAIQVQCSCGKSVAVKDEFAGRVVKCPACGKPIKVGGAAGQATASPAARTAPAAAKNAATPPVAAFRPKPAAPAAALEDLFAEEGFDRHIASVCPSCRAEMTATAILCTKCGFNKQTGEKHAAHKVAGVDIDQGTLALQRAAEDMQRDIEIQSTMEKRSGMPPWMLAMVLFILGSAVTIAVITVNAMNQKEAVQFNPLRTFVSMAGTGFGVLSVGALLTMIVKAFKMNQKQGFLSLTIVYLLYLVPKNMGLLLRPFLMCVVCAGAAGGLFAWASSM